MFVTDMGIGHYVTESFCFICFVRLKQRERDRERRTEIRNNRCKQIKKRKTKLCKKEINSRD